MDTKQMFQKELRYKRKLVKKLKQLNKQCYMVVDDIASKTCNSNFDFLDVRNITANINEVVYEISCLTIIDD